MSDLHNTRRVPGDTGPWSETPLTILFLAAIGGFLGFGLTGIGTGIAGHQFNYWQGGVALGVVGAGSGWLVGAAFGMIVTKAPPPTTRSQSWTLLGVAAFFVLAGFTRWWVTEDIVPPSSHVARFEALQQAIRLDAVLAAVTCLALASWRRPTRTGRGRGERSRGPAPSSSCRGENRSTASSSTAPRSTPPARPALTASSTSRSWALPNATFTLARQHFATEEHIRASGARHTFLRSSLYADFVPYFTGADGVIRWPGR